MLAPAPERFSPLPHPKSSHRTVTQPRTQLLPAYDPIRYDTDVHVQGLSSIVESERHGRHGAQRPRDILRSAPIHPLWKPLFFLCPVPACLMLPRLGACERTGRAGSLTLRSSRCVRLHGAVEIAGRRPQQHAACQVPDGVHPAGMEPGCLVCGASCKVSSSCLRSGGGEDGVDVGSCLCACVWAGSSGIGRGI